jgi:hypothetical protein
MAESTEVFPPEQGRIGSRPSTSTAPAGHKDPSPAPADGMRSDTPVPASAWARRRDRATRLCQGVVTNGATILHVLSLVAAFAVLLDIDDRMWFRVDDFEFLAKRGLHGATLSIWYPHAEHWSTIPILVYRALFTMFGVRSAKPYLVLLFVAHLTLAHLLWRAMRAWGAKPAIATALAAIFALLGAGGTDFLWSFQIGFVGSVLLGWAFILLVNHDGGLGRRDVIGSLVAIAALMTSGVAVTMVIVGGLVAWARRGWKAGLVAAVPPGLVYLIWYALIGHDGFLLAGSLHKTVLAAPAFVYDGLVAASSDGIGARFLGPVLLLGLAAFALRRRQLLRTAACPALMGLVGTVVFLAITSFGRDGSNDVGATSNRYVYVAVALLLPATGLAVSSLVARRRARLLAVLGLLVLVGIANIGQLLTLRNKYTTQSLATEQQIVAAAQIAAVGPVIPGSQPAANLDAPDLYLGVLRAWASDGDLPTGVHPGPISVVDAATQIQLGPTAEPLFAAGGTSIVLPSPGLLVHDMTDGCWSATSYAGGARLTLAVSSPTAVLIDARLGGAMVVTLTLGGYKGGGRRFLFGRQQTRWFDLAASPAIVSLAPAAGFIFESCWQR